MLLTIVGLKNFTYRPTLVTTTVMQTGDTEPICTVMVTDSLHLCFLY